MTLSWPTDLMSMENCWALSSLAGGIALPEISSESEKETCRSKKNVLHKVLFALIPSTGLQLGRC